MDAFLRLGLPRELVIDSDELDKVTRAASKAAHPDSGGESSLFEEVRKAGEVLKSPVGRLRLALELAGGDLESRGSVDGQVMDFFTPVAGVLERVEAFVTERGAARSALGKAVLDARVPPLKAEVEALIAGLGELEASLVGRFKGFDDSGWESSLSSMAETARALAFVIKWRAQLRAATGKLFEALLGG
ncbi:hypothetical protein V2O64_04810 [Verrucomicrobiaceae bacterium 227]